MIFLVFNYQDSMEMSLLIKFVGFFLSSKLQEEIRNEIENEIEKEQESIIADERAGYIQQISEKWKIQGEITRKIDARPRQTKF